MIIELRITRSEKLPDKRYVSATLALHGFHFTSVELNCVLEWIYDYSANFFSLRRNN
jgi:hypothetical protein